MLIQAHLDSVDPAQTFPTQQRSGFIGVDASAFFNLLSGYSDPPEWNKLAVAPLNLRETIYQEIDQLEKYLISVENVTRKQELFMPFALWALALILLELILRRTWLRSIP